MRTPDRPVSTQPPGKGPGEGSTSYPMGGRPHPAARDDPQRPVPRNPDDHVRGR
jgi:hypothetical protein